jgi:hypothetical protein
MANEVLFLKKEKRICVIAGLIGHSTADGGKIIQPLYMWIFEGRLSDRVTLSLSRPHHFNMFAYKTGELKMLMFLIRW